MCGTKLKSIQRVKDLGVKIPSNLKSAQQCNDAANKVNRMLGFIKRNFSFKNKELMFSLGNNFFRPHLEHAIQFCSPT